MPKRLACIIKTALYKYTYLYLYKLYLSVLAMHIAAAKRPPPPLWRTPTCGVNKQGTLV